MPSNAIDRAFTARKTVGSESEPTYAGALSFMRRKFSKDVRGADAVILGIPFDAAVSNRPGARFGPQAIRRASAIFDVDPQYPFNRDLFEAMSVVDYGDCLLDYGNHTKTPATIEKTAAKILKDAGFLVSLGGSAADGISDIDIDAAGNVYITGGTLSADFPIVAPPGGSAAFDGAMAYLAKLDARGSRLVYSTFLGPYDQGERIKLAVTDAGAAAVGRSFAPGVRSPLAAPA